MKLKIFFITVSVIYFFLNSVSAQAESVKADRQPVQKSTFPLFTFEGFDFADKNDKNWNITGEPMGWKKGGWIKTIADHELSVFDETSRDSSFLLRADLTF